MAHFFRPNTGRTRHKKSSNRSYEVEIKSLSDDGRGVGQVEGRTTFVEGGLVGERVRAKLTHSSARYNEARVTELLSAPAAERLNPLCSHYLDCGGCHVQHMSLSAQHQFKLQSVLRQLKHWSAIEPESIVPPLVGEAFHYRQRIRLSVFNDGGERKLGFRRRYSKQCLAIKRCEVMNPRLAVLIEPLQLWLKGCKPQVSHIELIDGDKSAGLVIRHTNVIPSNIRQQLQSQLSMCDVQLWFQDRKGAALTSVQGERTHAELQYSLPQYNLQLSFYPQDFIQANPLINRQMVDQALNLLRPQADEYFLDLFCGVGNFSLPLSKYVKSLVGVEGVNDMVVRASKNAVSNDCANARFIQANLGDEAAIAALEPCDGLLLDPPRSGASILCENITKLSPKRIVYVSCDSATFARDAQLLCKNNYRLKSLGIMDMFPQTSHSEVMGLFVHPSWDQNGVENTR